VIHHLCEISSYRGVCYIEFAAESFIDKGSAVVLP